MDIFSNNFLFFKEIIFYQIFKFREKSYQIFVLILKNIHIFFLKNYFLFIFIYIRIINRYLFIFHNFLLFSNQISTKKMKFKFLSLKIIVNSIEFKKSTVVF